MSEEMIERLALALHRAHNSPFEFDFDDWEPIARAALAATRTPTLEMVTAMCEALGWGTLTDASRRVAARAWQAAIDAALKEPE